MSPRLAIVHTESSLGWGGQEIRVLSEAQGLIARGHDVTLLQQNLRRTVSQRIDHGASFANFVVRNRGVARAG